MLIKNATITPRSTCPQNSPLNTPLIIERRHDITRSKRPVTEGTDSSPSLREHNATSKNKITEVIPEIITVKKRRSMFLMGLGDFEGWRPKILDCRDEKRPFSCLQLNSFSHFGQLFPYFFYKADAPSGLGKKFLEWCSGPGARGSYRTTSALFHHTFFLPVLNPGREPGSCPES